MAGIACGVNVVACILITTIGALAPKVVHKQVSGPYVCHGKGLFLRLHDLASKSTKYGMETYLKKQEQQYTLTEQGIQPKHIVRKRKTLRTPSQ